MMELTAAKAVSKQSLRRDGKKEGRESEGGGAVRVFGQNGFLVACLNPFHDAAQIRRLLDAPNAVPVRKHSGKIVGIRLLSFGDDRCHSGEQHGRSTVTIERVRNDEGQYVGSHKNVKHKRNCETWGKSGGQCRR
jgi:hypothetical protein